jgi:hypothetical protein
VLAVLLAVVVAVFVGAVIVMVCRDLFDMGGSTSTATAPTGPQLGAR